MTLDTRCTTDENACQNEGDEKKEDDNFRYMTLDFRFAAPKRIDQLVHRLDEQRRDWSLLLTGCLPGVFPQLILCLLGFCQQWLFCRVREPKARLTDTQFDVVTEQSSRRLANGWGNQLRAQVSCADCIRFINNRLTASVKPL